MSETTVVSIVGTILYIIIKSLRRACVQCCDNGNDNNSNIVIGIRYKVYDNTRRKAENGF